MAMTRAKAYGHKSTADLISLMDSPKPPAPPCPIGLLVDLSDTGEQIPYPKELLRVGEFDDTFGIFNNQKPKENALLSVPVPQTLENTSSSSVVKLDEVKKLKLCNISEAEPLPSTPWSPLPPKRKTDSNRNSGGSESSILDISNLSTFSVSDSESVLDEFASNVKEPGDAQADLKMSREIKELVAAERAEVKRRDSISSNFGRRNVFLTSPIPSPPSPTLSLNFNYIPTKPKDFSTPLYKPVQTNLFRTSLTPTTSTGTMTSPVSKLSKEIQNEDVDNCITTSGVKNANAVATVTKFIPSTTMATSTTDLCHNDDVFVQPQSAKENSRIVKRLSFSSTSSPGSSPVKSITKEPILSEMRKPKTIAKVLPTRPVGPGSIRGNRLSIQPLKATVPVPAAPVVSVSSSSDTSTHDISKDSGLSVSSAFGGTNKTNRPKCESAPVTRKFKPPIASSPYSVGAKSSSSTAYTTPSRPSRQSFNNVRSSGYGRISPNIRPASALNTSITPCKIPASPAAVSVTAKYIPSPAVPPPVTEQMHIKPVLGTTGQVPTYNKRSSIAKTVKNESGLRRPSIASTNHNSDATKENKSKLRFALSRPGFMGPKK